METTTRSVYEQHDAWIGRLSHGVHACAAQIFLLLMTGVITLEVVGRYLCNAGFSWSQEVCGLSFFLLVFLCQSNTWQEDRHIRMDIFYNNFNPFWKGISDVLTIACGFIFYSVLIYQGVMELPYQFSVGEGTDELELALWPFSLAMVFSCALTVLLLARFSILSLTRKQ